MSLSAATCWKSVETDFGQSDCGHPYPTDFGQTDFDQTDFGQTDFGQTDFGQRKGFRCLKSIV